jgi:hypothetical protein
MVTLLLPPRSIITESSLQQPRTRFGAGCRGAEREGSKPSLGGQRS